jgi:hypothetical protein
MSGMAKIGAGETAAKVIIGGVGFGGESLQLKEAAWRQAERLAIETLISKLYREKRRNERRLISYRKHRNLAAASGNGYQYNIVAAEKLAKYHRSQPKKISRISSIGYLGQLK